MPTAHIARKGAKNKCSLPDDIVWQIRDVKHGKVFSFTSQQDFVNFMMKLITETNKEH